MTTRELPVSEWPRLEGTSLGEVWKQLPTTGLTVLVVEDAQGTIVGHVAIFQSLHAEDWWIAGDHQKRGVVLRHLLAGAAEAAERVEARAFVTASVGEDVTSMLGRLGGVRLPGAAYSIPVGKR